MNRLITVFAFAACAFAEPEAKADADPQVFYNGFYNTGLYGNAHATAGLVHHTASGAVVPDDTLSVKAAKASHLAAKGLAYAYKTPVVANVAPYTYAAPYAYAPYTYAPYTYSHYLAKRDADSEPEAEADPQVFYNGFYNGAAYPYAHTYGYPSYSHVATAPVVTKTTHVVKPATVTATKYVAPTYATYAPYTHTYPYATYAAPAAYHTIGKRDAEADPEADAYYYSAYRNYGYPSYSRPLAYRSSFYAHPYNYAPHRYGYH